MLYIFTGNGKGKTTAAFGTALPTLGQGLDVFIIQFMKPWKSGEIPSLEKLGAHVEQFGGDGFVEPKEITEDDKREARRALERSEQIIQRATHELVILDEICIALDFGLLDLDEVLEIVEERPENVHMILTGRNCPRDLIERADLVTEMRNIKHPYENGHESVPGLEF